jgi:hypothetical protein
MEVAPFENGPVTPGADGEAARADAGSYEDADLRMQRSSRLFSRGDHVSVKTET